MYSLHGAPFGPLQCTVGAARTACPALTFFCRVYDVQRLQHNMCRVHHVKRYSVGFVSKGARRTVHSMYDMTYNDTPMRTIHEVPIVEWIPRAVHNV